jgi:hypothetical protein
LHKIEAISRKVWDIDPYIEIVAYREGLTEANLAEIVGSGVTVLIDEMDDLKMKILVREAAKQHKLPVIMAADDGDDALIDIERYDTNESQQPFDGRIPSEVLERIKSGSIARPELGRMIGQYFVGPENIPLRMYKSLVEVGKTLPSWPQLGGAAALSGVTLAYVARKIVLGEQLRPGRSLISLDQVLDLEHQTAAHQQELQQFRQMMGGGGNA